ncbi:wnt-activated inhibitory factor 2 [Solea solea]|uniref:wnt-activated inhibitory factor 2 n=1 Tax=Solea solea TaxID=90069 RepID=UPI00272B6E1A|nr:wnt-activated inhibitory factor 2 [Solea solea]
MVLSNRCRFDFDFTDPRGVWSGAGRTCSETKTRRKMWIFHSANNYSERVFFVTWSRWCLCYCAAVACLLLSPVRTDDVCLSSCVCARDSGTVTCREGEDTEVPGDIPEWTSTLVITGRNISTLQRGAFMTNGTELEVTTLLLSYNGIQVIEPYAFLGLPRLHLLDLSHNRLETISARAFHGLPELRSLYLNDSVLPVATTQLSAALSTQSLSNLHRLELAGNRLMSIPLRALDIYNLHALVLVNNSIETIGRENITNLYQQKLLRVYLSLNPFRCSCGLDALYYWLKNSSQCPDAKHLLCNEPEAKRGTPVEMLQGEDVDCGTENLETVSYVFLGIVLALIGVVFLMVLYLNRGGIKRWLNNIREACRDQMEVYHYRYEQDSDPRLANVAV